MAKTKQATKVLTSIIMWTKIVVKKRTRTSFKINIGQDQATEITAVGWIITKTKNKKRQGKNTNNKYNRNKYTNNNENKNYDHMKNKEDNTININTKTNHRNYSKNKNESH